MNELLTAMLLSRSSLAGRLDPTGRDIDRECGYPKNVTIEHLQLMYEREGPATRVVQVLPEETWSVNPTVYEVEDEKETEFEKAWTELERKHSIWSYLQRVDELSGIGQFGILLLGLDDLGPEDTLEKPAPGINERGEKSTGGRKLNLLYLKAFDQHLVRIVQYESDKTNPRFGQPTLYEITLADPNNLEGTGTVAITPQTNLKVHWSRIIHVADNRKSSEIFGVPRMLPVLNRLHDLRKVLGGSSEMLWKGGFPGYSFEATPEALTSDVELNTDDLKKQIENYQNGLQRYLALIGVTAKSLAPQVADPSKHIEQNLQVIAMTLGVPLRIFLGSEAGHLASSQDTVTWNRRLGRRQDIYVTPWIIRPFIDRLMIFGVLPEVKQYFVAWRDLNGLTEKDKADVSLKRAQALMAYVTSGAESVMPPLEFFTTILELSLDQAQAIVDAAKKANKPMTPPMQEPPPAPNTNPEGKGSNTQPPPAMKKPASPGSGAAA